MRRRVLLARTGRLVRVGPGLVTGLLLAATLTGCTADQDDPAVEPGSEQTQATAPAALDMRVRVTRVSGRLPAARRETVAARIGRVLSAYAEAAYLDDPGPDHLDDRSAATRSRRDPAASGAFAAFTPETARQARRDRDLLTRAGFGDVREVEPVEATALLSVLAPEGRPVGATARTTLRFAVTGADGSTRQRLVLGRVLLTPQDGSWRVFGYELAGSPAAAAAR